MSGAWSGDVALAVGAVVVFTVVLEALALRGRWRVYGAAVMPLGVELLAVTRPPPRAGRFGGVAWDTVSGADGAAVVWFWADRRSGAVPRGLHGVVHLRADPAGRVRLDVRWAPPWTPVVALAALSVVGVRVGDGLAAVALAAALLGVLLWAYSLTARRAAALLRQGFVTEAEDPRPQGQGGRPS